MTVNNGTPLYGRALYRQHCTFTLSRISTPPHAYLLTYLPIKVRGGRVVRCRTCDREVAGSNPARGCCVPTPTQRAILPGSVNEYQRKLGSKRAYHAMQWPYIRGLAASACVRLRAKETEISAAPWALRLGKGLYFTFTLYLFQNVNSSVSTKSPKYSINRVHDGISLYRTLSPIWSVKENRRTCSAGAGALLHKHWSFALLSI